MAVDIIERCKEWDLLWDVHRAVARMDRHCSYPTIA